MVDSKKIILDVKLGHAELQNSISDDEINQPMANGLTVQENIDAQVISVLMGENGISSEKCPSYLQRCPFLVLYR